MKNYKKYYIISGVLFVAFTIFTILVKNVDVQAIGPEGSKVGFASINQWFMNMIPFNKSLLKISDVLGILALVMVGYFGLFGVMQLVIKKGFKNVDKDLYILGGLYICILITYFIFEVGIVNYRPVILEKGLEASFPSSHTIMSLSVMLSAIQQFYMRLKPSMAKKIVITVCSLLCLGIVVTRFLSGVHWFTDIVGGIILAIAWFMLYLASVKYLYRNRVASED